MNNLTLVGRLVDDPDDVSVGEKAIAKYRLAVLSENRKGATNFINCVAFDDNAKFVINHLKKGKLIGVKGAIEIPTWVDSNGKRNWKTEMYVDKHVFISGE